MSEEKRVVSGPHLVNAIAIMAALGVDADVATAVQWAKAFGLEVDASTDIFRTASEAMSTVITQEQALLNRGRPVHVDTHGWSSDGHCLGFGQSGGELVMIFEGTWGKVAILEMKMHSVQFKDVPQQGDHR